VLLLITGTYYDKTLKSTFPVYLIIWNQIKAKSSLRIKIQSARSYAKKTPHALNRRQTEKLRKKIKNGQNKGRKICRRNKSSFI